MQPISVLIADDHALFREGLAALFQRQDDFQVVGEAPNGRQTLVMAEALQPDILLLDIRMPELGGLEVLPKIREKSPKTKVLILSGNLEEEFITQALQQGAKGCLLKTTAFGDLVKAIRATHVGELWAGRKVLTQVLENLLRKVDDLHVPLSTMRETLTDREQEIVQWVVQGMTNKEIASQLGISEKTVKTHLSNIFKKLNVSRRLQLLLFRMVDRT